MEESGFKIKFHKIKISIFHKIESINSCENNSFDLAFRSWKFDLPTPAQNGR
jgi:hypothetical protein